MVEANSNDGIVTLRSAYAFTETVEHLSAALTSHGATLFATIDHQAAAASVGLEMPPTTLIIFGNPKIGTPVMVERPLVALDLPSKVLVSEAAPGAVIVSFNSANYLRRRHSIPSKLAATLSPLEKLLEAAVAH